MRIGLRARVALWLGGAVVASGVLVVLLVVVLSGQFLRDRTRPDVDPAGGPPPALPGGGGAPMRPPVEEETRREAAEATLRDVRLIGIAVVGLLAVGAGGVAWVVAGRIVDPVHRMTATARSVADDRALGRRIALEGPDDELKEMADTFDEMLDRLAASFDAQRAFVANASHELRTPLAVMRTEVDVALDDPAPEVAGLRDALAAIGREIDRTAELVESMLWLARAEAIGATTSVDLARVVDDAVVRSARVDGADDGPSVDCELGPAVLEGDVVLIERLVENLVANAIRHNRPGGRVAVRTSTVGEEVRLVVDNDGAAIDPSEVPALFERFRRRERAGEGFGVGLALVAAVVAAHRGSVAAQARPEGGLHVEVCLPRERRVD